MLAVTHPGSGERGCIRTPSYSLWLLTQAALLLHILQDLRCLMAAFYPAAQTCFGSSAYLQGGLGLGHRRSLRSGKSGVTLESGEVFEGIKQGGRKREL